MSPVTYIRTDGWKVELGGPGGTGGQGDPGGLGEPGGPCDIGGKICRGE